MTNPDFVLIDVSVSSLRKVFIFIVTDNIYRIKLYQRDCTYSSENGIIGDITVYQPKYSHCFQVSVSQGRDVAEHSGDLVATFMKEVLAAVFETLNRLAAADSKHGVRLLLENYWALEDATVGLAASLPEMEWWAKKVSTDLQSVLDRYVEQQLQYSRFWSLLDLGEKLAALLRDVSPAEVPFQVLIPTGFGLNQSD